MDRDWSRLTYYPHYPEGHPRRFAHRQAMLTRLNQVESFFNHLRSGMKVATRGGDRNRIIDQDVQEAMFTLACVATTALVLADQRIQHGIDVRADVDAEITAARASTPARSATAHPVERPRAPEPATPTTRHPLRRPSAPAGRPRSPGVQPPRNITLPAGAVDPAITVNDDGTLSVSFTLAA